MRALSPVVGKAGIWVEQKSGIRAPFNDAAVQRVLHLDAALNYVNPTRTCLANAIGQAAAVVDRFGPGFVDEATLSRGLFDFISNRPEYDLLVASEHIAYPISEWGVTQRRMFRSNYWYEFPDSHLQYLPKIAEQARALDIVKIASVMETDFYRMSAEWLETLTSHYDYFLGFGQQFILPRNKLPEIDREPFAKQVNDLWWEFVSTCSHRVVSLPHFVGNHELAALTEVDFIGLERTRLFDLSVPGVLYYQRKSVLDAVQQSGLRISPRRADPWALARSAFRHVGPPSMRRFLDMNRQRVFLKMIDESISSFTCGSGLRWPLRKFFEIPARGGVLLCQPFAGADAAGFVEGLNYLEASSRNIVDTLFELKERPDNLERISRKGRELIMQRHTTTARASQIACSFNAIANGEFQGSKWDNGDFVVKVSGLGTA